MVLLKKYVMMIQPVLFWWSLWAKL